MSDTTLSRPSPEPSTQPPPSTQPMSVAAFDSALAADRTGLLARRTLLRAGAIGVAVVGAGASKVLLTPRLAARGLANPDALRFLPDQYSHEHPAAFSKLYPEFRF